METTAKAIKKTVAAVKLCAKQAIVEACEIPDDLASVTMDLLRVHADNGDLAWVEDMIAELEATEPHVSTGRRCPGCGEARMDELSWDDAGEEVTCWACGKVYRPEPPEVNNESPLCGCGEPTCAGQCGQDPAD